MPVVGVVMRDQILRDGDEIAAVFHQCKKLLPFLFGEFPFGDVLRHGENGGRYRGTLRCDHDGRPLLRDAEFKQSGLLIITFDEAAQSDISHGGGHVATVIISSKAKKNYTSQTFYQHQSLLRLTLAASGINTFPGAAAIAPDMTEFFQ